MNLQTVTAMFQVMGSPFIIGFLLAIAFLAKVAYWAIGVKWLKKQKWIKQYEKTNQLWLFFMVNVFALCFPYLLLNGVTTFWYTQDMHWTSWVSLVFGIALVIGSLVAVAFIFFTSVIQKVQNYNAYARDEFVEKGEYLFPKLLKRSMVMTHLIFWIRRILIVTTLVICVPIASDFITVTIVYSFQMLAFKFQIYFRPIKDTIYFSAMVLCEIAAVV